MISCSIFARPITLWFCDNWGTDSKIEDIYRSVILGRKTSLLFLPLVFNLFFILVFVNISLLFTCWEHNFLSRFSAFSSFDTCIWHVHLYVVFNSFFILVLLIFPCYLRDESIAFWVDLALLVLLTLLSWWEHSFLSRFSAFSSFDTSIWHVNLYVVV